MSTGEPIDIISYGPGIPADDTLRLCGEVSSGRRAVELGVSGARNAIAFAMAGAKSIAVDPDADHIASLRADAAERDLHIECHVAELADLGFITSGSVGTVVANRTLDTLDAVDDLGRLLRQVHRVLKPGSSFVIALTHPFHPLIDDLASGGRPIAYGTGRRTVGEWLTALERSNFRVDTVHELGEHPSVPAPTTLVLRARKEGS